MIRPTLAFTFACALLPTMALAASTTVPMSLITAEGIGASIGVVRADDTPQGLRLTPDLTGLPPGEHGFHLHEKPDCGPGMKDDKRVAGLAAGGHWDPANTGTHLGPHGAGHAGDLPVLTVAADGSASMPVTAPRLSVADLAGRALIIHAGGDTYSDQPEPLGGGGGRIACGVAP